MQMSTSSNQPFMFTSGLSLSQVRTDTKEIWGDKIAGAGVKLSTAIVLAQIGSAFFISAKVPPEVPLFFSRPWGIAQLASSLSVYWLVGWGILLWFIHLVLAISLFKKDKIMSRIIVWTGTLILFFTSLSLANVYVRVGV